MQTDRVCVIFAGSPEQGEPCIPVPEQAYVICADSSLRLCEKMNRRPDLVLGDFDSLGSVPAHLPHRVSPAEKDDTDTMLAVRFALDSGFTDIRIYGAFGGRLDHTLANIQTLEFLRQNGASGMLIGDSDWLCIQYGGETGRYPRRAGESLSVLALTDTCCGVCIRGTKYQLEQAELNRSFPLGVSNEITSDYAEIRCESGALLVIGSALHTAEQETEGAENGIQSTSGH